MIIDISQEVFSCNVYPGDPKPEVCKLQSIEDDELYNLSAFSMCAHNGTHVDAPSHFLKNGKTIDQIGLEAFVGDCFVKNYDGYIDENEAKEILRCAEEAGAKERILISGNAVVTEEAAEVFARAKIKLLGNESQTVGPEEAPMSVHLILLRAEVVLLEGIVLKDVPDGKYFLCAAPLNLAGCEGAPCRAFLM